MTILLKIIILLLIIPLTELYVLIEVGSVIGGLSTILLIIVTALLGGAFMRHQGMATMQKIQRGMATGQAPEKEILESVFIFIGGLFLLIPGFITDSIGVLFLIPSLRVFFAKKLLANKSFYKRGYKNHQGNVYEAQWSEKKSTTSEYTKVEVEYIENSKSSNDELLEGELIDPDKPK